MLLIKLQPKEKFSFLRLAHYLARIDNNYGTKEEEIILEYCAEMGIENDENFQLDRFSLKDTLRDFKSEKSKKIVILELMILIHADDKFDLKERKVISNIQQKFKISKKDVEFYSQWGKAVATLYEQSKLFLEEN